MNILRKLFRAAPTPTPDGAFSPSPLALKLATSSTTDFDGGAYENPYTGKDKRVLMICTEQRNMVMENGKQFSTGNHPVEMALPMLHLLNAGFAIDVATPTEDSAKIEAWAMPDKDEAVQTLFEGFADKLENPLSLADLVDDSLTDETPYIGIFIPGGHGAMLGLPSDHNLGKLLRSAHARDLFVMSICHGPAALLSAADGEDFIYEGYKMAVFPDAVDKQTPLIGYMPGHMPWNFGERLAEQGVEIVNAKADDTCFADRRLITGASPKAANKFGRLAANALLNAVR